MVAIEFQAQITDGTIHLPAAYRDHLSGLVRVIILAEELPSEPDMIDHLLAHPLQVEPFTPFARDQIYERP